MRDKLISISRRLDQATSLDADLLYKITTSIHSVFTKVSLQEPSSNDMTERTLHLVDQCLSGWTISLKGKAMEPDGMWNCSLREQNIRDNDALIGFGEGKTVSLALMRALLDIAIKKSPREGL
jgi:hypothetical protein